MNIALSLAGAGVRAAGSLSPRWGAAAAMPLFARVDRPRPVRPEDVPTMWRARRSMLRVPGVTGSGVDLALYEWGAGNRTVVLAHGWDGRASQFATLVRELVAERYHVVAFDAPAHGDSGGRHTYLVDWRDVLAALQERHGRFAAVVGHSFGGLAALVSVAGGIQADRVVTVAAPAAAETLLTQFQSMLRYSDRTSDALGQLFARTYFPGDADPFAWLSAVRRPLPGTPLLVIHDDGDRRVPFAEAPRIVDANPGSQLLSTSGFGHNRILTADPFLDAVVEFVTEPVPTSPRDAEVTRAEPRRQTEAVAI
ncbi:alpha/beta hydrolase [Microbacterium sp. HD4P20]|uniref:alpha/beta fold hydrolase n=1 Tax=Microbacterium sp. HD4P20 TaxID=2864874 RepID=UPI001C64176A|nr:alpha/beta hydrolase [Microbacterium sp. HD4P20]MCP2638506.1 alpha/beta hydrolase [Microbacterium sp. HD4P20]